MHRGTGLRRGASAALIALGCCSFAGAAHSQPSASDRATARALAAEGNAALKKKDFEAAEDRFRRADELVHAPSLVVDHARALVGLGRLGEAYERYESVGREEVPANAPWAWKRALKDAEKELVALKPRVAWLTLSVKGPSEPNVELDGLPFPATELGVRKPAAPGERVVVVTAKGFISKEGRVQLSAGVDASLDIELLPVPKPAPIIVTAPAIESPEDVEADRLSQRNRTLSYIAFGAGGVGIATGAIAGILWLKARSDINSTCGGLQCASRTDSEEARYKSDKRRYDTLGTISGIGFAVGIAGAAAGAAFVFLSPKVDTSAETAAVYVKPYVGPASVGVRGSF